MRKRRKEIQGVMTDPNETVFSMSTFPRLGCDGKAQTRFTIGDTYDSHYLYRV